MDLLSGLAARAVFMLLGVWAGITFAAGTALLVVSWRKTQPIRHTIVMPCPMCDDTGAQLRDGVWDVCPLCDGESALVEQVRELGDG